MFKKPRPLQWFQNSIFTTKCMLQTTDDIALFKAQDNDRYGKKGRCFTPLSPPVPTRISFQCLQRENPKSLRKFLNLASPHWSRSIFLFFLPTSKKFIKVKFEITHSLLTTISQCLVKEQCLCCFHFQSFHARYLYGLNFEQQKVNPIKVLTNVTLRKQTKESELPQEVSKTKWRHTKTCEQHL